MLGVWAGSVNTVMNHHQRILGKVAKDGGLQQQLGVQQYGTQGQGQVHGNNISRAPQAPMAMRTAQGQTRGQVVGWQYPMAYNEMGYCWAHGVPYWCRACGQ